MEKLLKLPPIWLIVFLVGLTSIAENIYIPALPNLVKDLKITENLAEWTLTIFLFGFAIGTFFWGNLSDRVGRKPCILSGLIIFIFGCILCYSVEKIEFFMLSRFIQGFGGSISSVLGQAVCLDVFSKNLGKVYSTVASAMSIFPAVAPTLGAIIINFWDWRAIFLILTIITLILIILITFLLPETHKKFANIDQTSKEHDLSNNQHDISIKNLAIKLINDKRVLCFGLIIGTCNGLFFSYFSESSFFLMENLGLDVQMYGFSFILTAIGSSLGGFVSGKLHKNGYSSKQIMTFGTYTLVAAAAFFSFCTYLFEFLQIFSPKIMTILAVTCQAVIFFSTCIICANALSLALLNYRYAAGTAQSLFGFSYYCITTFVTFIMGFIHNGTLIVMPIYFFILGCVVFFVNRILNSIKNNNNY